MIGGVVIGLVRRPSGVTMLHVRDRRSTDQICVDVREERIEGRTSVQVNLGDEVWWNATRVYWTRCGGHGHVCGLDFDIALPKIGTTHSPSHALANEEWPL